MQPNRQATSSHRDVEFSKPSDELKIAITFRRTDGGPGLTKFPAALSNASVERFKPDPLEADKALYELGRLGFVLTQRGPLTASIRGSRQTFERVFGTKLAKFELDKKQDYSQRAFYFPPQGAPWSPMPVINDLIDDAYIQWPHIYMGKKRTASNASPKRQPPKRRAPAGVLAAAAFPSPTPPPVSYFHLEVPQDVPALLNASRIHQEGFTGKGIRVAMIDSGFAHVSHPFFATHGFKSSVDLAPGAISDSTDISGHGSGESTNVFSVAPGMTFIGIKLDNDNDPRAGASVLEGFQRALKHKPHIITCSMGYDLRDETTGQQLTELPGNLAALEAEVQAAVAAGITVIFSAGNGHYSFPGSMPAVISAGGVFVDQQSKMQASDYASAFDSAIYSGRSVPDFCGLVGMLPHAAYIMLPIPPGCEIDRECAQPDDGNGDETGTSDGWGVFSGTSAAAPQLAGVCALLLEKSPSLSPGDIKALLRRTARDVRVGSSNPSSGKNGVAKRAGSGDDGATGAGLVDAYAAFRQL